MMIDTNANVESESQSDGADIAPDGVVDRESPAAEVEEQRNSVEEGASSPSPSDVDDDDDDNEPTNDNDNGTEAAVRTEAASPGENFAVPASAVEPSPATTQCKCLPHGVYAVVASLFATMAWLACLSKDGCDYARVTGPIVADITNNPSIPFIDAGLSRYRAPILNPMNGQWVLDLSVPCEEYNTDVIDIDAAWTFAKITSFLALVFGGGGAIFVWFSSCYVFQRHVWRWAGYELLVATALLALTFAWFATGMCHGNDGKDECAMHYGARADILACILWAGATLFILCKYPAERVGIPEAARNDAAQQSSTEVEMSDRWGGRQTGTTMVPNDHEII